MPVRRSASRTPRRASAPPPPKHNAVDDTSGTRASRSASKTRTPRPSRSKSSSSSSSSSTAAVAAVALPTKSVASIESPHRPKSPRSSQGSPTLAAAAQGTIPNEHAAANRWKSWWIRFITTWSMIGAFALILWAGHFYITILILLISFLIFQEIVRLGSYGDADRKLPGYPFVHWLFFFTSNFFFVGKAIKPQVLYLRSHPIFGLLSGRHNLISFSLYCAGLVLFVFSLRRKGQFKRQFALFGLVHVAILLVVAQGSFMISNVMSGIVWFVLPASLIIVNDTMAYTTGFFVGKTRLIRLSPKKTWEGFLGGLLFTVLFAWFFSSWVSQFHWMVCPVSTLGWELSPISCTPSPIFEPVHLLKLTSTFEYHYSTFQLHALILSLFASLIAPFGGFFASGLKRAFKIKDFGDSIPGHGGVTDRMDCQLLMGAFAYVYYNSVVAPSLPLSMLLLQQLGTLSQERKQSLLAQLTEEVAANTTALRSLCHKFFEDKFCR